MIISKKYALKLIKDGKATADSGRTCDNGKMYVIITRYDLQRTDHYEDD